MKDRKREKWRRTLILVREGTGGEKIGYDRVTICEGRAGGGKGGTPHTV